MVSNVFAGALAISAALASPLRVAAMLTTVKVTFLSTSASLRLQRKGELLQRKIRKKGSQKCRINDSQWATRGRHKFLWIPKFLQVPRMHERKKKVRGTCTQAAIIPSKASTG